MAMVVSMGDLRRMFGGGGEEESRPRPSPPIPEAQAHELTLRWRAMVEQSHRDEQRGFQPRDLQRRFEPGDLLVEHPLLGLGRADVPLLLLFVRWTDFIPDSPDRELLRDHVSWDSCVIGRYDCLLSFIPPGFGKMVWLPSSSVHWVLWDGHVEVEQ